MGALTCTQLETELSRRISQLSAADLNAAINRAIRWINSQGSYVFQMTGPLTVTTDGSGFVALNPNVDIGKAKYFENPDGTPINRASTFDPWLSANYNLSTSGVESGFDRYFLRGTDAPEIRFFPQLASSIQVNYYFHTKTVSISGASLSNLPADFDDVIVDMAEAEERRIYDVGEIWPQMLARSQDRILKLLDGYKSPTMEPTMVSEAAQAVQEKASIGTP